MKNYNLFFTGNDDNDLKTSFQESSKYKEGKFNKENYTSFLEKTLREYLSEKKTNPEIKAPKVSILMANYKSYGLLSNPKSNLVFLQAILQLKKTANLNKNNDPEFAQLLQELPVEIVTQNKTNFEDAVIETANTTPVQQKVPQINASKLINNYVASDMFNLHITEIERNVEKKESYDSALQNYFINNDVNFLTDFDFSLSYDSKAIGSYNDRNFFSRPSLSLMAMHAYQNSLKDSPEHFQITNFSSTSFCEYPTDFKYTVEEVANDVVTEKFEHLENEDFLFDDASKADIYSFKVFDMIDTLNKVMTTPVAKSETIKENSQQAEFYQALEQVDLRNSQAKSKADLINAYCRFFDATQLRAIKPKLQKSISNYDLVGAKTNMLISANLIAELRERGRFNTDEFRVTSFNNLLKLGVKLPGRNVEMNILNLTASNSNAKPVGEIQEGRTFYRHKTLSKIEQQQVALPELYRQFASANRLQKIKKISNILVAKNNTAVINSINLFNFQTNAPHTFISEFDEKSTGTIDFSVKSTSEFGTFSTKITSSFKASNKPNQMSVQQLYDNQVNALKNNTLNLKMLTEVLTSDLTNESVKDALNNLDEDQVPDLRNFVSEIIVKNKDDFPLLFDRNESNELLKNDLIDLIANDALAMYFKNQLPLKADHIERLIDNQIIKGTKPYSLGNLETEPKSLNFIRIKGDMNDFDFQLLLRNEGYTINNVIDFLNTDNVVDENNEHDYNNGRIADNLINFDPENLIDIKDNYLAQKIVDQLKAQSQENLDNTIEYTNFQLDKNYILKWNANVKTSDGIVEKEGIIGQLFPKNDELGFYQRDFATAKLNPQKQTAYFPFYEGYFVDDSSKSRRENLRLKSFENEMVNAAISAINQTIVASEENNDKVIYETKLNKNYRSEFHGQSIALSEVKKVLVDSKHLNDSDLEYFKMIIKDEMGITEPRDKDEEKNLIARAESLRTVTDLRMRTWFDYSQSVHFGRKLSDQATTLAKAEHDKQNHNILRGYQELSNNYDHIRAFDGDSMRALTKDFNKVFDSAQSSSAKNAGILRVLHEHAEVKPNGEVIDSPIEERSRLVQGNPLMKYSKYDPVIRQQKNITAQRTAKHIAKANVAYTTLGGFNFDDGVVISDKFAERFPVTPLHKVGASERFLKIGDKLTDTHGNKGVSTKVIKTRPAPNQTMEDFMAELEVMKINAPHLYKATLAFQANPDLDIVANPYFYHSRHNAGVLQEGVNSELKFPLVNPFKNEVKPDGISQINYIITDIFGDDKTNIVKKATNSKGRKIGAQMLWVLGTKGVEKFVKEAYSNNSGKWNTLKYYSNVLGMNLSKSGDLLPLGENQDHLNHDQILSHHINLEDYQGKIKYDIEQEQTKAIGEIKSNLQTKTSTQGGLLILPEGLHFNFESSTYENDNMPDLAVLNSKYSVAEQKIVESKFKDNNNLEDDLRSFLPLLPPNLRNKIKAEDGSVMVTEYARNYDTLVETISEYLYITSAINSKGSLVYPANNISPFKALKSSPDARNVTLNKEHLPLIQSAMSSKLQKQYDTLKNKVLNDQFVGRHNIVREELVNARQNNSGTAIVSANPDLDLDQVEVAKEIAETLGIKNNEMLIIDRAPNISSGGAMAFRLLISNDDNLQGIAINPSIDSPFSGDFDGDTFGLIYKRSKEIQEEIKNKMHPALEFYNHNTGTPSMQIHFDEADYIMGLNGLNPEEQELYKQTFEFFPNAVHFSKDDEANPVKEWYAKFEEIDPNLVILDENGKLDMSNPLSQEAWCSYISKEIKSVTLNDNSFFASTIQMTNEETVIESLKQQTKERDGAKGKLDALLSKEEKAALSEAENANPNDFKDGTLLECFEHGQSYADSINTQNADAAKADATANAGTDTQLAMAYLQDSTVASVLNVTYNSTQAPLQLKHDAEMIKPTLALIQDKLPLLLKGKPKETDYMRLKTSQAEGKAGSYEDYLAKQTAKENGEEVAFTEYDLTDEEALIIKMFETKYTKDDWVNDICQSFDSIHISVPKDDVEDMAQYYFDENDNFKTQEEMEENITLSQRLKYHNSRNSEQIIFNKDIRNNLFEGNTYNHDDEIIATVPEEYINSYNSTPQVFEETIETQSLNSSKVGQISEFGYCYINSQQEIRDIFESLQETYKNNSKEVLPVFVQTEANEKASRKTAYSYAMIENALDEVKLPKFSEFNPENKEKLYDVIDQVVDATELNKVYQNVCRPNSEQTIQEAAQSMVKDKIDRCENIEVRSSRSANGNVREKYFPVALNTDQERYTQSDWVNELKSQGFNYAKFSGKNNKDIQFGKSKMENEIKQELFTKQFDLSSEEDYRSQLKEKAKELLEQRFEESQGHSTTLEKENKAKPLESSEFTSLLNNEVEIEMEV